MKENILIKKSRSRNKLEPHDFKKHPKITLTVNIDLKTDKVSAIDTKLNHSTYDCHNMSKISQSTSTQNAEKAIIKKNINN